MTYLLHISNMKMSIGPMKYIKKKPVLNKFWQYQYIRQQVEPSKLFFRRPKYSLITMRQLHSLKPKPKLDIELFVDFCGFTCFYQFLHELIIKFVLFWSADKFYDQLMQELVKTGKSTEINKQSHVKFWLHWIKYGAVSYSLSCTWNSKLTF